jgi:3-phenylpropionate/trans-cinnamate dioxygenase ferredoxin subunit
MGAWIDIVAAADVPAGCCHGAAVDGLFIAVCHVAGGFHAIEDMCTHEQSSLSDGSLDGTEITCPLHGARFSVVTGAALSEPAYEPVRTFPVRVERGMVQVWDDEHADH